MADLIAQVKEAARPDIVELALAAGFRSSPTKAKFHCVGHADNSASAHLYADHLYCFSCGETWDVVNLEQISGGGSVGDAVRRLAGRYRLSADLTRLAKPTVWHDSGETECWRTGLLWSLEREIASAKLLIPWEQEGRIGDDGYIRSLTQCLDSARGWTARQAAEARTQMEIDHPAFATGCFEEGHAAMALLADALLAASEGVAA